jgi:hypothetical protein
VESSFPGEFAADSIGAELSARVILSCPHVDLHCDPGSSPAEFVGNQGLESVHENSNSLAACTRRSAGNNWCAKHVNACLCAIP